MIPFAPFIITLFTSFKSAGIVAQAIEGLKQKVEN